MRIDETLTQSQAISRYSFFHCACLNGRAQAAGIANPYESVF